MNAPQLRNRIALVNGVATILLVGLAFVLIYLTAKSVSIRNIDAELMAEFAEVSSSMAIQGDRVFVIDPREWNESEHGLIETSPIFLQAVNSTGEVLRRSANLNDRSLSHNPALRDTFVTDAQLNGAHVRQIQGSLFDTRGTVQGYLIVAMSRTEADRLLSSLSFAMFLILPGIAIITVFFSRIIGTRLARPVISIISTSEQISRDHIDKRVPIPARRDELYRLTITINSLLDRLQDALVREQQFTSDASHELRTPLAALKGTLEVLVRQPREPKVYEEKLRACINEVDRLASLVEQLLFLARCESGATKPAHQRVDLGQAVTTVIDRFMPLFAARQISPRLTFDHDCYVTTDPVLVNTVIENVLANAIKFSPDRQSIEISIGEDAETTCCTITDHGPGMSDEQVQRVFDRFYRTDSSRSATVKGSGLGLAVAKKMADLLGLTIVFSSNPGTGTSVVLRFPKSIISATNSKI